MKQNNKYLGTLAVFVFLIFGFSIFRIFVLGDKKLLYVALGDSVAAGAGLRTSSDRSGCDRNDESYPNLLATAKEYELKNLACSGATIDKGIMGSQKVENKEFPAQISELEKQRKPELITITIGANDIDWTEPILKCFLATCGSEEETAAITQKLGTLEKNLESVFENISNLYDGQPPKVIMTSYYTIADQPSSTCNTLSGVTNEEIEWVANRFNDLNKTIKNTAAKFSYVTFAELKFENKGLCTYDAWVQGIGSPAPLHPTANGQEAIKKAILNVL